MWIIAALHVGMVVFAFALTAVTTWLLYRFVFRRRLWSVVPSLAIALALSCIPAVIERLSIRSDLAGFAADEVRPGQLTLQPGSLLHVQDYNHAGLTCHEQECPFAMLPFVTHAAEAEIDAITDPQGDPTGMPLDMWRLLEREIPALADRSQPFPYRYAYISASVYWYATAIGAEDYRKPEWPENGKGVHMLVELPADGLLDLTDDGSVHFRRFNLQDDLDDPLMWGIRSENVQTPTAEAIFQDLAQISAAE